MAFLNTTKAKDILKSANVDVARIAEGKDGGISLSVDNVLNQILRHGKYKDFECLDKAGKYLKESMLTRSTSHKKYDFSSLQSTSSLNLQKLYKDILSNDDTAFNAPPITFEKKSKKEIELLDVKFSNSLKKIQKIIGSNEVIKNYVLEALKNDSVTRESINNLDGLISDHVLFVDQNKVQAAEALGKQHLNSSLKSLGKGSLCSIAAGLVLGAPIVGLGAITGGGPGMLGLLTPLIVMGFGIVVGVGTAGIGIVISTSVAAGFLIAALVVHCNKERFGTIALKKEIIKINDEFRNALKYLNKAADLVRRNTKISDTKEEIQPTDEHKKILNAFLDKQRKLWEPYTTVAGREYNYNEDGKHNSGLIKVKNEKTSTIGKMKEGIALTWVNMEVR